MLVVRLVFLFLLFTSYERLDAQWRISGTVESESHSPIPYAAVTIKRTTDTHERMAQTDSAGTFSFDKVNNGAYTVTITNVGYEPYSMHFDVSHDTSFTIQLTQSARQLGEVTVTGTKAATLSSR